MSAMTAAHPGTGPVAASRIFVGRSLRHSLRDGEGLLLAVLLPVMLMLLFTVVFGGAFDSSGGYVDYVTPGIVVLCSGFGASSVAVSVNRDVTGGAMRRFRSLPIPAATCLVGHVVASVLRNLLATAIVLGAGLLLGFRPAAGPLQWLGAVTILLCWIVAVTVVFAAIGLLASTPEAANGYGFAILFLPYLSSAFVPTETMPDWLRPLAEVQPVTPITDAVRAWLTGADAGSQPLIAVLWCVGIVAVGAAVIAWRFPRR
ncbi:ABC transporter permease [Leucobacter sp. CSA1]|uniref:Transport permease protein n=1 Tax=Leucobacter chromiisoli TaxID=2796471 RepID=A0A934UVE0_9MICO|nr:ABC transporter permease [Leucobacter chromiisoli]MBK0419361.1 ABC transporter permease [Leucobacter chromiisoli]